MFTGLIQQVGKLAHKENTGKSLRLTIASRSWNPPLALGESMAVNGICLTVTRLAGQGFSCDVLEETILCSNLASKPVGSALNLERAVKLGEPLGGHLITGHVEGTGKIIKIAPVGRDWKLDIACADSIMRYIVPKGSIACDGISLTVAALENNSFSVNIIPFTWNNTTLQHLQAGDTLNLETDLIGKYAFRATEHSKKTEPLTLEQLRQAGFME